MARPKDPHLDPLRAPTQRGQHPHTLRAKDEVKNPQHMYERRDTMGAYHEQPRVAPQAPQQQPPSIFDNPLVQLGLGAALMFGIAKLLEGEGPRKNPAPAPVPPSAPVFVMPSAGPALLQQPSASAQAAASAQAPAAGTTVKKRKKRERKTTQARASDGTFRPSGTRKKAIVEGKEKKR